MNKKYFNRFSSLFLLVLFTLFSANLKAQFIDGNQNAYVGEYNEYYFINGYYQNATWSLNGSSPIPFEGYMPVTFDKPGANNIYFYYYDSYNNFAYASFYVEVGIRAPILSSVTQPTCSEPTGSFTIEDYNYSQYFTYTLHSSSGTSVITQPTLTLSPGSYYVTVSGNFITSSFSDPSDTVVLNPASTPATPVVGGVTPSLTPGTGSVVLSGLPSTGSWVINPGNISGTGTTKTITGLNAGVYNFTITNSSGCVSTGTASVNINSNCITGNENYIFTTVPQVATTSISTLTSTQKQESVTYYDGLGRPKQIVGIQAGGNNKDVITHVGYDVFGRQSREYLPYNDENDCGVFRAGDIDLATKNYYKAQFPLDINTLTPNPFSEKQFEASPLNIVLKQAAPGQDWALGSGHEIKLDYLSNLTVDEVRHYKAVVTPSGVNSTTTYEPILQNTEPYYAEHELYKNITYDENTVATPTELNGSTVEFRNKEGQVVLKRNYGTIGTGNSNEKHDTYYVYDDYGNLTYVLPPKVNTQDGVSQAELDELCYQYKYDQRNRLVEKKLPGKQWEFIVYDKLDRVVATGPALSPFSDLTSVGWMITKYDAFSRPVLTGWYPTTVTSAIRATLQNTQNGYITNFSETKIATAANTTVNGVAFRYTNVAWPTSGYHVLTVNYYDDYNYPNAPTIAATVEGEPVYFNSTIKPKGLPTGSWIRTLQTSTAYANELSYSFYDKKARPIRTYSTNFLGGYTYADSKLDFTGKPVYTITYHKRLSGSTELKTKDAFTYSPQGRLLTQTHQINDGTIELIASNTYDELGQLVSKKVGNNVTTPTQKVDYTYNIRGWLKGINDISSLTQSGAPKDLFAFKINYNTISSGISGVNALYNGNIAETHWATNSDNGVVRTYGYQYDNLNRLRAGVYKKGAVLNMYNESLTYDKNGNIMSLIRNGNSESMVIQIDNLTYSYGSSNLHNRLTKVVDSQSNTAGLLEEFKDNGLSTDDYSYDSNGNMLTDANKGITTITYNHLNLPTNITFGTAGNIVYIYNATGQKTQKIFNKTGQSAVVTDYLVGYQYNNSFLKFFPTTEGYVEPSGSSYKYIYQYKDHLGNVRLSYDKSLVIQEENNYYPFGLKQKGYNTGTPSTNDALKYRFGSKEYQDELGLNEYAFGWRDYDPAIGRWNVIDQLAEKYITTSPYAFVQNNPLINREIDGREFDKKNEKKAQKIEKKLDKQIAKLNKEINKLQKKGQSPGDRNDRVAQLNKSKSDVSDMRGDTNNFYKFEKASQNNGAPETKRTGANEITMFTDDFSKQIHEGRHGGQIARGEYNIDMSGSVISGNFGVSKEIDAYKAQYSYDGKIEYVPSINMATDLMKLMTQGVMGFKQTISNMSQINNTFIQSLVDNPGINQAPIYPDPAVNPTYYQQ